MPNYIAVGRVVRTHGTRGWVRVEVYSGLPDRFEGVRVVFFRGTAGAEGKILSDSDRLGNAVLLKFKGVDDREAARELVGKEIWLPEDQAIKLPEGEYFVHDLIGLQVVTTEGELLGRVEEVMLMGGNDVYVVRGEKGETLIPAVEEFVKEVDVKGGKIVVRLWEEM